MSVSQRIIELKFCGFIRDTTYLIHTRIHEYDIQIYM